MHAMKSLKEQVLNQYVDAVYLQDVYIYICVCVISITSYHIISYNVYVCIFKYWMHTQLTTNMYLQAKPAGSPLGSPHPKGCYLQGIMSCCEVHLLFLWVEMV